MIFPRSLLLCYMGSANQGGQTGANDRNPVHLNKDVFLKKQCWEFLKLRIRETFISIRRRVIKEREELRKEKPFGDFRIFLRKISRPLIIIGESYQAKGTLELSKITLQVVQVRG